MPPVIPPGLVLRLRVKCHANGDQRFYTTRANRTHYLRARLTKFFFWIWFFFTDLICRTWTISRLSDLLSRIPKTLVFASRSYVVTYVKAFWFLSPGGVVLLPPTKHFKESLFDDFRFLLHHSQYW